MEREMDHSLSQVKTNITAGVVETGKGANWLRYLSKL